MQTEDQNSCSELRHSMIFPLAHLLKEIVPLETKQFGIVLSLGEMPVGFNLYNST